MKKPLFSVGQAVATPGALVALFEAKVTAASLLDKHTSGDWGEVCKRDAAENDTAVTNGLRILSSYNITPATRIWVITEADRSSTTLLLPEEY